MGWFSLVDRALDNISRRPWLESTRYETWTVCFTPLCLCRSEETLRTGGPFHLVSVPGEVDSLGWWSFPPGVCARGSGLTGLVVPSTWCLCQGKWTHWAGGRFHLVSVPGEVDSLGWWSLQPGVYARGSGLTGLVIPSTWCLCRGKWTHWAGGPFHLVSVPGEVDSLGW